MDVHRARNVTRPPGTTAQAEILLARADVPDYLVVVPQGVHHVLELRNGFAVDVYSDAGRLDGQSRPCLDGQAGGQPAMNAAVEVSPASMAHHVQRPRHTTGPAATFVVVDDDFRPGIEADPRQQSLEPFFAREPARSRWRAVHQLAGFDQNRAGNMSLQVAGGIADMQDEPAFRLGTGEFLRFDDSWCRDDGFLSEATGRLS